jgi:enoyl-CoA hydratase/carnithine racemase
MSTSSSVVETSLENRVLRVALNRPDKRNALNSELCHALVQAFHEADANRDIGAILLTANGTAFCAGMDLIEASQARGAEETLLHEVLFTAGTRLTKPIVAAVNGPALGGGTGLVANAHIVFASPEATFGLTEIRLGMWPFVIWHSVSLAFGERRALELALSGRIFGAEEAEAYGLVHQITPPEELDSRAADLAAQLAAGSVPAVRSGLEFVYEARYKPWREVNRFAVDFRKELFRNPDFAEGVRAFQEKRAPRWPSLGHYRGEE